MAGEYISQQAEIARLAQENNIDAAEIDSYFKKFLKEIAKSADETRSSDWLLSRAELCVWQKFFPKLPFPGKIDLSTSQQLIMAVKKEPHADSLEKGSDANLSLHVNEKKDAIPSQVKTEPGEITEMLTSTLTATKVDTSRILSSQLSTVLNNLKSRGVHDRQSSHGLKSPGGSDWIHDRFEAINHTPSTNISRSGIDSYRPAGSARRDREKDTWRPAEKVDNSGRLSPLELKKPFTSAAASPPATYISRERDIWHKARQYDINSHHVSESLADKKASIASTHPTKSRGWQLWAAEKAVWARFFWKSSTPFPGLEPGSVVVVPPAVKAHVISQLPIARYVHREQEMEKMARKKGIRPDFFKFLQKARDHARATHCHCESEARAFMADEMTWTNFFSQVTPFPGPEPPQSAHADCCKVYRQQLHPSILKGQGLPFPYPEPAARNRVSQPDRPQTTPTAPRLAAPQIGRATSLLQRPTGLGASPAVAVASRSSIPTGPASSRLVTNHAPNMHPQRVSLVQGGPSRSSTPSQSIPKGHSPTGSANPSRHSPSPPPPEMTLALSKARAIGTGGTGRSVIVMSSDRVVCEDHKLDEVMESFVAEGSGILGRIGARLGCTFHYNKPMSSYVMLWATPLSNGDAVARNNGAVFLRGWVDRSVRYGTVKPSMHFQMIGGDMHAPDVSKPQANVEITSVAALWDEYRAATGASEIDCLVVEEDAKREGYLRMVFDKISGETVTLEEMLKRDRARMSSRSQRSKDSARSSVKRGSDDASAQAGAKRHCM